MQKIWLGTVSFVASLQRYVNWLLQTGLSKLYDLSKLYQKMLFSTSNSTVNKIGQCYRASFAQLRNARMFPSVSAFLCFVLLLFGLIL